MISSNVILDPDRLAREVEYFGEQGEFVYDIETVDSAPGADDRGNPVSNVSTWVSLATHGRTSVIPMGHPLGTQVIGEAREPRVDKNGKTRYFRVPVYEKPPEQMSRADVFPQLNKLFADPDIAQAAHGATFDNASVAKYRPATKQDALTALAAPPGQGGYDLAALGRYVGKPQIPAGKQYCTLVMRWLADENRKRYGLKWITKDIYKFVYDDEEIGRRVEKYPFNMVAHYGYCDAQFAWLEYLCNKRRLRNEGLWDLLMMETDLVSVLSQMRLTGVRIDTERLETLRVELSERVDVQERAVYAAAGRPFNLNAPRQKQEILFKPKSEGGQGLKPWKLTDGAKKKVEEQGAKPDWTFYSTDEESLSDFRANPVVGKLLDWQETAKVLSTYVIGYLGDPDEKDKPTRVYNGRIYPDFVQYGAATGRFSCRSPNLQNVPAARSDLGKSIRSLFLAEPGNKLIVADYGQVELVLLAHFIGHGSLFDGFWDGIDPHALTASRALGKDPADVTGNERQRFGKSTNFATIYGAGISKLASMMEVSPADARRFLDRYRESSPEIEKYRNQVLAEARRQKPPHVTTLLGRKRRLPSVNSSDNGLRSYAERQLFNAKIQGSSADLTKMAMIRYTQRQRPGWNLLLTIHDELVVSAPAAEAEEAKAALVESMIGKEMQELLSVPLKVDVHIVDNWGDAKD